TGTWAKISVSETGFYQLTDAVVRKAGFSNPSKVKIYGYGGALQPEKLTGDYLTETDDLKEVPTCVLNGRRIFYAVASVNWASSTATVRDRNPYSDKGYYFLTENDDEALMIDSADFVSSHYPSANDYHSHHEIDNYAWYHGGRNLYEGALFGSQVSRTYSLPAYSNGGTLVVAMSYNGVCEATVTVNDSLVGSVKTTNPGDNNIAAVNRWTFRLNNGLQASNEVVICQKGGSDMRLDYITIISDKPQPLPDLSTATLPAPEFVYRITNQDHHADAQADMVIIIPTTQKFVSQAERLKTLHETRDGMKVNIVPADELFNEFSSGTPDANAYRRYLKMLYDRAEDEQALPRYLLHLG
ncbi:MAG: Por secretion system protein, partial [Prevotella sp.]|nr:Por secretion system protein [Prevotella sp.]